MYVHLYVAYQHTQLAYHMRSGRMASTCVPHTLAHVSGFGLSTFWSTCIHMCVCLWVCVSALAKIYYLQRPENILAATNNAWFPCACPYKRADIPICLHTRIHYKNTFGINYQFESNANSLLKASLYLYCKRNHTLHMISRNCKNRIN